MCELSATAPSRRPRRGCRATSRHDPVGRRYCRILENFSVFPEAEPDDAAAPEEGEEAPEE